MRAGLPKALAKVRQQLWSQGLIDKLLTLSASASAPIQAKLERLWLELVKTPQLSELVGHLASREVPKPLLKVVLEWWVKHYKVEMSDAALPLEAFPTLDAFFTRELKPGLRPIDERAEWAVSPADSVLNSFGDISADGLIPEVKGNAYSAEALLAGESALVSAKPFVGGQYGVFYLSPRDYHRVHSPVSGTVTDIYMVDGAKYPVNSLAVRSIPGLFVKNKRLVFMLESEHGPMALVMVGATNVGHITSSVQVGDVIDRGAELGIFHLGSTVVLLTSPEAKLAYDGVSEGEYVRMGQAVLKKQD